jgi:DNA polymerase-3 subunit epsilon
LTRWCWRGASIPAEHNTLDDLCACYRVDSSRRTQHGAPLDAELLGAVYVEVTTTRQAALQLEPIASGPSNIQAIVRVRPEPLSRRLTADYRNAHRSFVRTRGSDAIWRDYFRTLEDNGRYRTLCI